MVKCLYNLDVSESLRYVLGVINIIQGLASSLGNILVFFVVISNRRLWTRSNAYLLSLATTDLLVGILLEPMTVAQFFSFEHRQNCNFNKVRRYLSTLLMGGAVGSIGLISYDRWTHLTKTIRYNDFMSKKKVVILITIAWLIPLLVPVSRFMSEAVYSAIIIIYGSAILALMTTCYFVIVKIVRSQGKAFPQSNCEETAKATVNHIRVAKAIVIIILCLLATIVPISVYFGVTALNAVSPGLVKISDDTKEICYAVLMTIGLANSGINPVIYYFRIPEFRASMKRVYARIWTRRKQNESSQSKEQSIEISL